MKSIEETVEKGYRSLSEFESKQFLANFGIPVTREELADNESSLINAVEKIGYPVVLKGCSPDIAHKTEKNLVRLDIRDEKEAIRAFHDISNNMNGTGNSVLVQELVRGKRELVVGLTRDPQFGPCVMFGLGGIFTEILNDVSFRTAPLNRFDAFEMTGEIRGRKILGAIRGMDAVDKEILAHIMVTLGKIGVENRMIKEIDINPLIISGSKPVAVDALVVLEASLRE